MRTQNSGKELLYSIPIEVQFAGFRSDTLRLAQAGWDLSMNQSMDPREYGQGITLAIRHEGAKLYGLSQRITFRYGDLGAALSDPIRYAAFLAEQYFEIVHIAPEIRFVSKAVTTRSMTFAESFSAIDPFPQERLVQESIQDFKFFKVSNPSIKDIIVCPELVPELLDMVLKAQMSTIEQVKQREKSRSNAIWMRDSAHGTRPASNVQAQIITLAS